MIFENHSSSGELRLTRLKKHTFLASDGAFVGSIPSPASSCFATVSIISAPARLTYDFPLRTGGRTDRVQKRSAYLPNRQVTVGAGSGEKCAIAVALS